MANYVTPDPTSPTSLPRNDSGAAAAPGTWPAATGTRRSGRACSPIARVRLLYLTGPALGDADAGGPDCRAIDCRRVDTPQNAVEVHLLRGDTRAATGLAAAISSELGITVTVDATRTSRSRDVACSNREHCSSPLKAPPVTRRARQELAWRATFSTARSSRAAVDLGCRSASMRATGPNRGRDGPSRCRGRTARDDHVTFPAVTADSLAARNGQAGELDAFAATLRQVLSDPALAERPRSCMDAGLRGRHADQSVPTHAELLSVVWAPRSASPARWRCAFGPALHWPEFDRRVSRRCATCDCSTAAYAADQRSAV